MYFTTDKIFSMIGSSEGQWTDDQKHTHRVASTLYYYTLVIGQIAAALATTTHGESLAKYLLPNHKLSICIILEIIFAVIIIYEPAVESVFVTTGLTMGQMLYPWMSFVFISICEEVRKSIVRKKAHAREVSPLRERLLDA